MKMKEIMEKTDEELRASAKTLAREIFDMRSERSVKKRLDKPHLLQQKKRERARILTALSAKSAGVK